MATRAVIPQLPTESDMLSANGAPVLPLGGVDIAACVRGRIVDIDRNGGRGTDGGAVGKVVIAGNDVALLVAQDGR